LRHGDGLEARFDADGEEQKRRGVAQTGDIAARIGELRELRACGSE